MFFSAEKRGRYYKTIEKLLLENNYTLEPRELAKLLAKENITDEAGIFKTREFVEKIYKRAIKGGLVCTKQVRDVINLYLDYDYEELYSLLSRVCGILENNSVYRTSAPETRSEIRRKVMRYCAFHKISATDGAALFALKDDCGLTSKKRRKVFPISALFICALIGLLLGSPLAVAVSFLPVLAIISGVFEKVYGRSFVPCSNIEDLPKTLVVTLIESSRVDKIYRYFERLIAQNDDKSLVYGAILTLPDSRSLTGPDDSALITRLEHEHERLVKKYGDRFCFYLPKRQYIPEKKRFCCARDIYSHMQDIVSADSSFDSLLGAGATGVTAYTLFLPYECEPSAGCIKALIKAMSHKQNRPIIEKDRLCGGRGMIFGKVKAYIPQKHSPFSRISLHESHSQSSPVIFDNIAFALLIKRSMPEDEIEERLNYGYTEHAQAYVKASSLDLGKSIPSFPQFSINCEKGLIQARLCEALSALSPIMAFLLLIFSNALNLFALCHLLALLLCFIPYFGIIKDICFAFAKGENRKGLAFACDFIIAAFYAVSLIPFLFFESLFCAFGAIVLKKSEKKQEKDSAKHFFAFTLSALGCGIVFLGLNILPYIALTWLIAPLFVLYLGGMYKRQNKPTPQKLLEKHINGAHDFIVGNGALVALPLKETEREITPTELGLYLTSLLAFCDLGKERVAACYPIIADTLSFIERLPTSYGLYYDRYFVKALSPTGAKAILAEENGNLLTCLICLYEGLREVLPEDDILIARCERLIEGFDITRACDRGQMTSISTLPAAFFASAAKKKDFLQIDPTLKILSETGSAMSYMLPFLFLPLFPDTLFSRTVSKVFRKNIAYSKRGLWGVTSCHTGRLDNNMNYIFSENGIEKLSYAGVIGKEIYSPYAAFLFLTHFKISSMALLFNFRKEKALGKYGFYEAVDFTCAEKTVVRCYNLLHLCMSVVATANYSCDNVFVRRFCRSKYANPYLYLLRAEGVRSFAKFKVSELIMKTDKPKDDKKLKYAVPSLCATGDKSLSFFASSCGHLMFLSEGKELTANCFKEYDMKDTANSVKLTFSTERAHFAAFEGEFYYSDECTEYLSNHSDIVSSAKIIKPKGPPFCEISLTVKGAFCRINACLEFCSKEDIKIKDDRFILQTPDKTVIFTSFNSAAVSKEGDNYKIGVFEECPDGIFRCSFYVGVAENEKEALSRFQSGKAYNKTYRRVIEKEALLAALLFKAGAVRDLPDVSPMELQKFDCAAFSYVCALCPSDLRNITLVSSLSRAVNELSLTGIHLKLFVICKNEETKEKVRPMLLPNDLLLDYDEQSISALEAFSAMFISDKDFLSPECYFRSVLNQMREIEPTLVVRCAPPSRNALPSSHKTAYGCLTSSKAVFYRELLPCEIDFCLGSKMQIKLSSSRLIALYQNSHPLTCFMRLCVLVKGNKYDLLASCHTIEKSDNLVSFVGQIEGCDIRCEIFIDDELQVLVIRVCGERVEAALDLIPFSMESDPRLCKCIQEQGSLLYRSVWRGFYSEHTLFVSKPCKGADKQIIIVGLYDKSPRIFYAANEKYSCPSGCEGPVADRPSIIIYSPLKECDHLVCHRIPEFFSGLCEEVDKRIYGFPVLSVTNPELFKETIIEYAASFEKSGSDGIILSAAIAEYFRTSGDVEFLKEKIPYFDGTIKESVYMHGIRAIENYGNDSDISRLIKYLVCKMYEPVCRQMNERLDIPSIDRESFLSSNDPMLEICRLIFEGSFNKAVSKLVLLCPSYAESDPSFLGIFYMLYLNFVIGLKDCGDRFTIRPKLCAAFPAFKMSYTKGASKFIISASLSDKNLTCLDKIPYEGEFYFDNSLHTIDISEIKRQ